MKIAIVGAGLSGLSAACHLLFKSPHVNITLFDAYGIGQGGASNIASGLMHPYAGKAGVRSLHADQALKASMNLIKVAEKFASYPFCSRGIIRHAQDPMQQKNFINHIHRFGDVLPLAAGSKIFQIQSGLTVYIPGYLASLWKFCQTHGADFVQKNVTHLEEVAHFDQVVLAVGASVQQFSDEISSNVKMIKGQTLIAEIGNKGPPMSSIGKGYIAICPVTQQLHLGSTYEHVFTDANPDIAHAKEIIIPRITTFFPEVSELKIVDCRSGLRVANRSHYYPILQKITNNCWAITSMGSRGLLYHGLFGKMLAEKMLG